MVAMEAPALTCPPDFRTIDKLRDLAPDLEGVMRQGRFSEEQMVAIIREADRDSVAAVAKRHGLSEQTIYRWSRFRCFRRTMLSACGNLRRRMHG